MTASTVALPSQDRDHLGWMRFARAAALSSLLFFLTAVIVGALLEARENGTSNLWLTLWTLPLWLPYLWMYLQMKSKFARRQKKGLALAIAYGAGVLLITAPCALGSTGAVLQGSFAVFAALQLFLAVYARKAFRAMEDEPGDGRILATRILVTFACFGTLVLAAIAIPNSYRARSAADESAAASSVRTILVAQSVYAKKNPQKGFATELSDLGPSGARLMDQDLASGKKSGYTFHLIAGPPDESGRTARYVVIARPVAFQQTGRRSFFVDASGTIRFTDEDRDPTAQDRPFD